MEKQHYRNNCVHLNILHSFRYVSYQLIGFPESGITHVSGVYLSFGPFRFWMISRLSSASRRTKAFIAKNPHNTVVRKPTQKRNVRSPRRLIFTESSVQNAEIHLTQGFCGPHSNISSSNSATSVLYSVFLTSTILLSSSPLSYLRLILYAHCPTFLNSTTILLNRHR